MIQATNVTAIAQAQVKLVNRINDRTDRIGGFSIDLVKVAVNTATVVFRRDMPSRQPGSPGRRGRTIPRRQQIMAMRYQQSMPASRDQNPGDRLRRTIAFSLNTNQTAVETPGGYLENPHFRIR